MDLLRSHEAPGQRSSDAQSQPPTYHEHAPLVSSEMASDAHTALNTDGQQPGEGYPYANEQEQSIHPYGEHEPATTKPERTWPRNGVRSSRLALWEWKWEFLSMVLSMACFAAIIIVLLYERDRALSDWHFTIAPNTLVSVFSTLTEAGFMLTTVACVGQLKWIYFSRSSRRLRDYDYFQEATEPIGALRFIWTINIRAKLAVVGSVIALLSLAVGAFTQQIISYSLRWVPASEYADRVTFGSSNAYDSGIGLYRQTAVDGDGNLNSVNTVMAEQVQSSMTGAIMSGLYDLDTSINVACPTGNCTWAPFTTLGISAQCLNVTTNMTATKPSYNGLVGYTYTLPGNVSFDMTVGVTSSEGAIATSFRSVTHTGWNYSANWVEPTLVKLYAVNVPVSGAGDSDDPIPLEWAETEGIECTIGWTALHYQNLSVVNGVFEPGLTTEYALVAVPIPGETKYDNDDIDDEYYVNSKFAIAAPDNSSGNASFYINPNDHAFIIQQLNGSLATTSDADAGKALLSSSNLTERIQNITTAMSYIVAQNPNATSVYGTALAQESRFWVARPE
ncbi:hypothetical protein M406DRAFT_68647 [Cryphonectria parasitica EP155]|uniref:Uncharacterized protein n=1 Tax=Cryphonectria parasitica (strain ATCC 38755 / EP155) TaxID=660469 RepID=A0A9P4Y404_CRYP1|nr:uncharacterized protein M406DRAFT_68647 [Cryphonectria parasitica EP155]KAF3766288.1 hypothetical protein M406DRAFT_68647 [Cryphonectria parasitica EP155]